MAAAIEWAEPPAEAARKGLALLRLMAEAADKQSPDWVKRRVEQLEFLDERAVRWRVSIDFVVPETAPVTHVGGRPFRLVPLTSWEKNNLVAFDLRDDGGNTTWLPTSKDTDRMLSSALAYWARDILHELPPQLEKTLEAIVSEWPSREQKAAERDPKTGKEMDPFEAVAKLMVDKGEPAEDYLGVPPPALKRNPSFWSQVNELWRNFLIIAPVADMPGTRHVFKLNFESKVEFRPPDSRHLRIAQSLGWRAWRLELFIGGRGGSHHLEIAAPPGVDIIRIRARPRTAVPRTAIPDRRKYVMEYGGSPHVHIRIGADWRLRYLATIRVRVSRPGWLTMCWLAGLVIPAVLLVGALKLRVLFSAAPEASTAATLLLALLAVFATMLVSPGAHPLASRLLWGSRILILLDSGVFVVAAGLLLLDIRPAFWWWTLFALSALCAVMLTVSRLWPKGPPRERPWPMWIQVKNACTSVLDRLKKTSAWRWLAKKRKSSWDRLKKTSAWRWLAEKRKKVLGPAEDKEEKASLAIPPADGYHYGDNPKHQWDEWKQAKLVRALRHAERTASSACRATRRLRMLLQLTVIRVRRRGVRNGNSPPS
jgi:hypothetical protein